MYCVSILNGRVCYMDKLKYESLFSNIFLNDNNLYYFILTPPQ